MLPLAFGFGSPVEIAIVAGVIVLLFGGAKIAGFGKNLGEGIKEFKKATSDDTETPPPPAVSTAPSTTTVVTSKAEDK